MSDNPFKPPGADIGDGRKPRPVQPGSPLKAVLVTLGRRKMPGRVAFSGRVRYVRFQGDFFLDDVQVDDLQLTEFPPALAEVIRQRGPGAMRRALEGHPIYTIKGDTAREALAKLAVQDVRVVQGRLRVTFLRLD